MSTTTTNIKRIINTATAVNDSQLPLYFYLMMKLLERVDLLTITHNVIGAAALAKRKNLTGTLRKTFFGEKPVFHSKRHKLVDPLPYTELRTPDEPQEQSQIYTHSGKTVEINEGECKILSLYVVTNLPTQHT